ncbi:MAG: helix-turn-helix transcriptional regulator [Rhodospirillaceae bacterium]
MTQMTPGQAMKAARKELGLSTVELARALGYEAERAQAQAQIRRYESDSRPVPPWIQRLVEMYRRHGVPPEWRQRT